MPRTRNWNVALVGAGAVGKSLGRVLSDEGVRIAAVIARTERSARKGARFVGSPLASTRLEDIPPDAGLVLLAVPHGAVKDVALSLSRLKGWSWRGKAVCHASGMLSARVLEPLRRKGALTFSFHPLQTFPRDYPPARLLPSVRGICYGVDGSPAALRAARSLARKLKGRAVPIPPSTRVFYHAACVAASGHLAALLGVLDEMHSRFGPRGGHFMEMFGPILRATLENTRAGSPSEALTGPVARGGTATVRDHLSSVRRFAPPLLPYYRMMTLQSAALARRKGAISARKEAGFRKLVHSFRSSYREFM
ncbi:MAG: DUF2520 domain-containing protein [Bacteroidota bacterium]